MPIPTPKQSIATLTADAIRTERLGPLSYEAQAGMYLHPTYAATQDRYIAHA